MPEIRDRIFSIFGLDNNKDIDFEHYTWIYLFFETKLESLNFSLHIWFINKFFYPEYSYLSKNELALKKYKYLKRVELENILINITINLNPEDHFRKLLAFQILEFNIYSCHKSKSNKEAFVKIKKLIEQLMKNQQILISFIYLLLK